MTANTASRIQDGLPLTVYGDGLMPSVHAGDIATAAADTFVPEKFRINYYIPLYIFDIHDLMKHGTDNIPYSQISGLNV